jgi:hypothetical protein
MEAAGFSKTVILYKITENIWHTMPVPNTQINEIHRGVFSNVLVI